MLFNSWIMVLSGWTHAAVLENMTIPGLVSAPEGIICSVLDIQLVPRQTGFCEGFTNRLLYLNKMPKTGRQLAEALAMALALLSLQRLSQTGCFLLLSYKC